MSLSIELASDAACGTAAAAYQAGRLRELGVDLDDLAGDRGVDVAGGLHTLNVAEGSSRRDLRAGFRQLHEHHLSKMALHPVRTYTLSGGGFRLKSFVCIQVAGRVINSCSVPAKIYTCRFAKAITLRH